MNISGQERARGWADRGAAALSFLALLVAAAGCGAESVGPHEGDEAPTRSIGIDGLSIELPPGWDGYARWLGREATIAEIWAASRPFIDSPPRPEFPHGTLKALSEDGVAVEIVAQPPQPDSASWPDLARISLADGYFLADGYEGQPAPHVSSQIIQARVANRAIYVQVFFGRTRPDAAMRAAANRVLGTLFQPREVREDGFVRFEDPAVGISGRYPAGWYRARALTDMSDPREVLTLATYPLRGGAEAGECAPDTARADMPRDGVFIWLLEYRPFGGKAWPDLLRERFPPRPERFSIGRDLVPANEDLDCFSVPGDRMFFRAADRPFDLFVAFGREPTREQLAEVNGILDSLEFELLPPAPTDT